MFIEGRRCSCGEESRSVSSDGRGRREYLELVSEDAILKD